jgi:hypothetical protein
MAESGTVIQREVCFMQHSIVERTALVAAAAMNVGRWMYDTFFQVLIFGHGR